MSERLEAALRIASDTREIRLGEDVLGDVGRVFRRCFEGRPASVIADANTYAAAGENVEKLLQQAGVDLVDGVIFDEPDLHAESGHVERLQRLLGEHDGIAVAVGSGTVNDLAKLASHRCERPYMVVGTAASMDGYTAYGASITHEGHKQTFFCPAPVAVVADLDVICQAPAHLNAAGYADLVAKVTAGADWILSDALGVEAIDLQAWSLVQTHLREWTADPNGVRRGGRAALCRLMEGLLMTGLAMQWSKSSRPASGAEHQFSHLWDMEDHRYRGSIPLHGFKVGIGTIASTLLYEQLLAKPLQELDAQRVLMSYPGDADLEALVTRTQQSEALRGVARSESRAKHLDEKQLADVTGRLKAVWPTLKRRLHDQLIPSRALARMLRQAGAPARAGDIGIDADRLRRSYVQAQQIRRRFTVLDLAVVTGLMPECLERLFAAEGPLSALEQETGA